MMRSCAWCGIRYDLDPASEIVHLKNCDSFQDQSIAEWKNGKPFVKLPGYPHILVEKWPFPDEN